VLLALRSSYDGPETVQIAVFVQTNLKVIVTTLWNGMRIAMALSIRDVVRRNPGPYAWCCRDVWETEKVVEKDNMSRKRI
jgi:hypothetical protein